MVGRTVSAHAPATIPARSRPRLIPASRSSGSSSTGRNGPTHALGEQAPAEQRARERKRHGLRRPVHEEPQRAREQRQVQRLGPQELSEGGDLRVEQDEGGRQVSHQARAREAARQAAPGEGGGEKARDLAQAQSDEARIDGQGEREEVRVERRPQELEGRRLSARPVRGDVGIHDLVAPERPGTRTQLHPQQRGLQAGAEREDDDQARTARAVGRVAHVRRPRRR